MRFLVDANLSPRVAEWLRDSGYGALHVVDLGLAAARDREIFEHAAGEGWTVLTSALDFGDILARAGGSGSVVIMPVTEHHHGENHDAPRQCVAASRPRAGKASCGDRRRGESSCAPAAARSRSSRHPVCACCRALRRSWCPAAPS